MSMDLYLSTVPPTPETIRLSRAFCALVEYAGLPESELTILENLLSLDLSPLYNATHPEAEDKSDAWQPIDGLIACTSALLQHLSDRPDIMSTLDEGLLHTFGHQKYFTGNAFLTELEQFRTYLERAKQLGAQRVLIEAD
jgi:hypothetical protein